MRKSVENYRRGINQPVQARKTYTQKAFGHFDGCIATRKDVQKIKIDKIDASKNKNVFAEDTGHVGDCRSARRRRSPNAPDEW
jgi:hypothetical protein